MTCTEAIKYQMFLREPYSLETSISKASWKLVCFLPNQKKRGQKRVYLNNDRNSYSALSTMTEQIIKLVLAVIAVIKLIRNRFSLIFLMW